MSGSRRTSGAVLVHTISVQIITYAYRPALAYAALDAGGVPALLGIMSAIFAVPALLLAIPAGHLVDRTSERVLGLIGAILMAASLATAILGSHSFILLLLATLLLGVAHLTSIVAQQTLVANSAKRGSSDAAFGWYTLAASIGQSLGPLLLAIPGPDSGTPPLRLIFVTCLALTAVVLVAAALMPPRSRELTTGPRSGALASAARNLKHRGTVRALLASGIALASVDITLVYWPAIGDERNLPPVVISAMLVARAVATMASRGLLGVMTRRWGRKAVMVSTLTISTIALGCTSLPLEPALLLTAAVVYGLGIGACQPITMAWLSSLAPAGGRGSMLSLRLVGNRFAQSTVPALASIIAAPLGASGVIGVLTGFLVVATWAGAAVPDAEES